MPSINTIVLNLLILALYIKQRRPLSTKQSRKPMDCWFRISCLKISVLVHDLYFIYCFIVLSSIKSVEKSLQYWGFHLTQE